MESRRCWDSITLSVNPLISLSFIPYSCSGFRARSVENSVSIQVKASSMEQERASENSFFISYTLYFSRASYVWNTAVKN